MARNNVILKIAFLNLAIFFFAMNASAQSDNTVRVHLINDPESLNPINCRDQSGVAIFEQIFGTLLKINPETLEADIPWIAQSLPTESDDHLQYDFTIVKGIKFADGVELTGADVIFSLKAILNPYNSSGTQNLSYCNYIKSAELIDNDPYNVRFTLWEPHWQVYQVFSSILAILPKHIFDPENITDNYSWDDLAKYHTMKSEQIEKLIKEKSKKDEAMRSFGEKLSSPEFQRDPKYIQGSGPYKLKQWVTNDRIVLEKNLYYENNFHSEYGEAYPQRIYYKEIFDWNAAIIALKAGDIDIAMNVPPLIWRQIDTVSNTSICKGSIAQSSYTFLGWNLANPIFNDSKTRLALAYLIDRKLIINKILTGMGKEIQTPVTPLRREYNKDIPQVAYDPEKAKQLLKDAGWEDHDGDGKLDKKINGKFVPFKFTFIINSGNEVRKQVLLVIAEELRKVGINADIMALEWSVYLDRLRNHQFDANFGAWLNDDSETDFYQIYHSSQAKNKGSNYGNWKNKKADILLTSIRKEMDVNKRIALDKEFQKLFYEEQPVAMLWQPLMGVAWNKKFTDIKFFPIRNGFNPALWKGSKK